MESQTHTGASMPSEPPLIWDKIGRIAVYLLFGLVPLWFLPFSAFPVADAKLLLAGLLIFGAFAAWFIKILASGKVIIPGSFVWLAALAFLGALLLSLIFSSSRFISFLGNAGQPDIVIAFVLYVGALLIVPVFLRDISHIMKAIFFFGIALALIALFAVLQAFSVFVLPFALAQNVAFNTVGTLQALAAFLGAGFALLIAALSSLHLSFALKIAFGAVAALVGAVLLLVNFSYVWLGLLIVFALIVAWQVMHSSGAGKSLAHFNLPMFLIVATAILFFVQIPVANIVQFPVTISPSVSSTLTVMRESYQSNVGHVFVGSGPGTFLYEYLQFRPSELNATAFFGLRFSQGFSAITTFLTTLGLLGVGSLLVFAGYIIWQSMKGIALLAKLGSPYEKTALVSFVAMAFLMFTWFVYPANFSLFLFAFLFGGILFASMRAGHALPEWSLVFSSSPQRVFAFSFLTVIFLTVAILGIYTQGQKYAAAVFHASGANAFNTNQDVSKALSRVGIALNLDNNDRYWRTTAQLALVRANEVLQDSALSDAARRQGLEQSIQGAVRAAQRATQVNPADPLNWGQLASVYENVMVLVPGAGQFAAENYARAWERDPKNPAAKFIIGRTYVQSFDNTARLIVNLRDNKGSQEDIAKAEAQGAELLTKALEELDASLALKADYAPAHFLIAQIYERQGNRKGAIEKTVEVRNINPQDIGVGYQLGLLYYFDNQINAAEQEFRRVLALNPDYSNARYFLGLALERRGDAGGALAQFREVARLNPTNEEVPKIIANLERGAPALEGLTNPADAIEPPVQQAVDQASKELEVSE